MSKSGFFCNDKDCRFSLIFEQRFQKHEFQARMFQKKYSKFERSYRVSTKRIFIVIIMNNCWNKNGIFVKLISSLYEMEEFESMNFMLDLTA